MGRRALAAALSAWALAAASLARAQDRPRPIRFARGSSGAVLEGSVLRGERALFSLEARAGQRMALRLSSLEDNAVLAVTAPGGAPLPGAAEGDDARAWTGALPASGAYLISIGPTRGNATWQLAVEVR